MKNISQHTHEENVLKETINSIVRKFRKLSRSKQSKTISELKALAISVNDTEIQGILNDITQFLQES